MPLGFSWSPLTVWEVTLSVHTCLQCIFSFNDPQALLDTSTTFRFQFKCLIWRYCSFRGFWCNLRRVLSFIYLFQCIINLSCDLKCFYSLHFKKWFHMLETKGYKNIFLPCVDLNITNEDCTVKLKPLLSFWSLIMHAISCHSHFVVMDTDKKKEEGKKEKENIICVHSNWVRLSAAKILLRDVRCVY